VHLNKKTFQFVPQVHDHAWTFGDMPVIGCTPVVVPQ
jgi:hypothetical protein